MLEPNIALRTLGLLPSARSRHLVLVRLAVVVVPARPTLLPRRSVGVILLSLNRRLALDAYAVDPLAAVVPPPVDLLRDRHASVVAVVFVARSGRRALPVPVPALPKSIDSSSSTLLPHLELPEPDRQRFTIVRLRLALALTLGFGLCLLRRQLFGSRGVTVVLWIDIDDLAVVAEPRTDEGVGKRDRRK